MTTVPGSTLAGGHESIRSMTEERWTAAALARDWDKALAMYSRTTSGSPATSSARCSARTYRRAPGKASALARGCVLQLGDRLSGLDREDVAHPGRLQRDVHAGLLALHVQRFADGATVRRETLGPDGEAMSLAEDVALGGSSGRNGAFSVSQNGVLAYETGTGPIRSELVWFDRHGRRIGTVGERADYGDFELSPDGTRVALSVLVGVTPLFKVDSRPGPRDPYDVSPNGAFLSTRQSSSQNPHRLRWSSIGWQH
jgi:hypothetical protein